MKISLQTIVATVKHGPDIWRLFRVLSAKEYNCNFFNGRHMLWLRSTLPDLFIPGASVPTLSRILSKHYSVLRERFSAPIIRDMSRDRGVLLYQNPKAPDINIYLSTCRPNNKEAELVIQIFAQDTRLFRIGFVIVDENTIFAGNRAGILITLLQGYPGQKELNHATKKAFNDISLDRILFSSLVGLTQHCGLDVIYGIPYHYQYTYRTRGKEHIADVFADAYDQFFTRFIHEINSDYYCMDLPLQYKPHDPERSLSHRKRADKRRRINDALSDAVQHNIAAINAGQLVPVTDPA